MTDETYKRGYRDGFEDGYRLAQTKLPKPGHTPNVLPELDERPRCRVCGLTFDGPMGYVCPNDRCPSRVWYGSQTPTYTYGMITAKSTTWVNNASD